MIVLAGVRAGAFGLDPGGLERLAALLEGLFLFR
jgi:hypothetical protein